MNDEFADLPPMPDLATAGSGVGPHGDRWTVKAGGTASSCLSLMFIEMPDGSSAGGGGMGGPALPAGRSIHCSVHWSDPGVSYLVGRVAPAVARVEVEFAGAEPEAIAPFGQSAELGVAFIAAILPADARLTGVSAWDVRGALLGRQPMSAAPPAPGAPGHEPAGAVRSGWRPFSAGQGR